MSYGPPVAVTILALTPTFVAAEEDPNTVVGEPRSFEISLLKSF